ncbi:MAG: hypothetical protein ACKVJQ_12785 [Alphaproteobacteria bacterium]|jgi:citrate lyase beta subunit
MRATFFSLAAMGVLIALMPGRVLAGEDTRELVQLPPMMQEHLLTNMRDHLVALDEILGELAEGKVDAAASIAEERLGMSSLSLHGADHLAQFMPKAMGEMGTQMHRAASRFVLVAQDAELNPGIKAQHNVYQALQDITQYCNACHSRYKIR